MLLVVEPAGLSLVPTTHLNSIVLSGTITRTSNQLVFVLKKILEVIICIHVSPYMLQFLTTL